MFSGYSCWIEGVDEQLMPQFPFAWMARAYAVYASNRNRDHKVRITCWQGPDQPQCLYATYLNGKEVNPLL